MENHPEITFASTSVSQVDAETFHVTDDLTRSRVSPSQSPSISSAPAPLSTPYGNQRIGFEGKTTINRKDWGVNWNVALEAGGVLVSEKVTLEFELSAIRTGDAT